MSAGRLEVICGPMFAGKTTLLMALLREHGSQPSVAIKHARDTRYHAHDLATHDGVRCEALALHTPQDVMLAAAGAAVVGIDEAHFFGAGLGEVCLALVARGVHVIVAGIEIDHCGDPFEPFPLLLAHADIVHKRIAPCAVCGGVGVRTQRLVATSDRVVVGGAESYQTRCRRCFVPASRPTG